MVKLTQMPCDHSTHLTTKVDQGSELFLQRDAKSKKHVAEIIPPS